MTRARAARRRASALGRTRNVGARRAGLRHAPWLLSLCAWSCLIPNVEVGTPSGAAGGAGLAAGGAGAMAGAGPSAGVGGAPHSGVAGGAGQAGAAGESETGGGGPSAGHGGVAGSAGSAGGSSGNGGSAAAPSAGSGGTGQAGSASNAACDSSDPNVLFCDDFEAGFKTANWGTQDKAHAVIVAGTNVHGASHYLELTGIPLASTFGAFASAKTTVSFWIQWNTPTEIKFVSFADQTGSSARTIDFGLYNGLPRWRRDGTATFAPSQDKDIPFPQPDQWTCVELVFTEGALNARVLQPNNPEAQSFSVPQVDNTSTPLVDDEWNKLPANQRMVSGFPAFSATNNVSNQNRYLIDDVQVTNGSRSVCN